MRYNNTARNVRSAGRPANRHPSRPAGKNVRTSSTKKPPAKKKSSSSSARTMFGSGQRSMDMSLLLVIIVLVVFGLIMVFSASAPSASAYQGNPYYYIIRQALFAGGGIIVMLALSKFDYHLWSKFALPLLVVAVLLLLAVYIPGVGVVRNQARRWINIGISTLQPSEVVKVAVIVYFSVTLANLKDRIKQLKSFGIYVLILGGFSFLLFLEPHLSATIVVCAVGCFLLVVAGARIRHFIGVGALAVPVLIIYIMQNPYQLERIMTALNPFADAADAGFQVVNSLYAIGSGGIFGLGLGMSRQKFLYLPEPQNDFIFAIICEELGLLGAALVIVLFAILIYKGYRIAQEAPDMLGTLMASGITTLIALQAAINIAVVTATIPATGIALPFFSYGGTSLLILLGCMGILLNISRQTVGTIKAPTESGKK